MPHGHVNQTSVMMLSTQWMLDPMISMTNQGTSAAITQAYKSWIMKENNSEYTNKNLPEQGTLTPVTYVFLSGQYFPKHEDLY